MQFFEKPFLEQVLLVVLAELAVGLAVINVLVWNGFGVEDGIEPAEPARVSKPQPPAQPTGRSAAVANHPRPAAVAERRPTGRPLLRFELEAARGDSWMSVRRGSAEGDVLYEGALTSGESLRFTARRLWLRLGAAGHVELSIDGRAVEDVPSGTVELVLPKQTA